MRACKPRIIISVCFTQGLILDYIPSDIFTDTLYYIVSPKDIIVAKPRTIQDHIDALFAKGAFKEALEMAQDAKTSDLLPGTLIKVGQGYMQSLMDQHLYEQVALSMPKILGHDGTLWQTWIYKFAESQQLGMSYQLIPTESPVLESHVYELVLSKFLDSDRAVCFSASIAHF